MKEYRYFVSFAWREAGEDRVQFANAAVSLPHPVRGSDDVVAVEDKVQYGLLGAFGVAEVWVLSWRRFESGEGG
jgi:hypothetical protein